MNGRRTIVGLCMLSALLISAFAAQSASAITIHKGTTAFTCKEGPGDDGLPTFETEHCKPGEGSGKYGHYTIKENTTTELKGKSGTVGEETKLKSTVGGVPITLSSTSLSGTGTMKNTLDPSGEHHVHGEGTIVYSGVTVNIPKCFVYTDELPGKGRGAQGIVDTEPLTATTTGKGHSLTFTPKEGTVFARFWILDKNKKTPAEGGECAIAATYEVTGTVTGVPSGATTVFTHAETTAQNTLKLGPTGSPIKAGIEGSLTIEGRDPEIAEDKFKPLSVTTVETETK